MIWQPEFARTDKKSLPLISEMTRPCTVGRFVEWSAWREACDAYADAGPYRFVAYAQGNSLTLARNPGYWGAKARWDHVTFRFIPDAASRVAALLSGEVDAIDDVPPGDHARIKGDPRFAV